MRTSVPDEQGWYWAKDVHGDWRMACVSTCSEKVWLFDEGLEPPCWDAYDLDGFPAGIVVAWYGPFQCPGGDFGGLTVVSDEELHDKAALERKVIGIVHFDYRYCRDEGHGSSITFSGLYTRDEAEERIHREVKT